jgi:hypothetical protein
LVVIACSSSVDLFGRFVASRPNAEAKYARVSLFRDHRPE